MKEMVLNKKLSVFEVTYRKSFISSARALTNSLKCLSKAASEKESCLTGYLTPLATFLRYSSKFSTLTIGIFPFEKEIYE